MTEGTYLLVLTNSAFWSSSRWPLARREGSIPLGGRYRQVSLYFVSKTIPWKFSFQVKKLAQRQAVCRNNQTDLHSVALSHRYALQDLFHWYCNDFVIGSCWLSEPKGKANDVLTYWVHSVCCYSYSLRLLHWHWQVNLDIDFLVILNKFQNSSAVGVSTLP